MSYSIFKATGYYQRLSTWSEGFIVQLHRKENLNKHKNYRGTDLKEMYIFIEVSPKTSETMYNNYTLLSTVGQLLQRI